MRVLGLDTSGYANAIGITDGRRTLADCIYEARTDSLEKIVVNIDETLKSTGMELKDIDGIGVGLGPGSWTGIRVGVTAGKILAFSTGKPVAGVSTLDALAYGARDSRRQVYAVISAGTRDTVYAARYEPQNHQIQRRGDYYVGSIQGLAELIRAPALIVGADAEGYCRIIRAACVTADIDALTHVPRGADIALLAAERLARGESDDALALTPLYLKESTAKALREQRKKEFGHAGSGY